MVALICAVDENGCIEDDNRVPWRDTPAEEEILSLLDGCVGVVGHRTASFLGDVPCDVRVVSKHEADCFNTLDKALDTGRDCYILGGLHVFHQVMQRGLASYLNVFRVEETFDGTASLSDDVLGQWRLAKELARPAYVHQVFVPTDASV